MRYRDTGASRGFGFAYFRSLEHAKKAVAESRQHELDGRSVEIQLAKSREEMAEERGGGRGRGRGRGRGYGRYGGRGYDDYYSGRGRGRGYGGRYDDDRRGGDYERDMKTKKIFVGGIPHDATQAQFEEYFSRFGSVTKAILKTDMATGRVRGFGFVTFADETSADKCVDIRVHELNGKEMECVKAFPKSYEERGGGGYSRGRGRSSYRDDRYSGGGGYTSSWTSPYAAPSRDSYHQQAPPAAAYSYAGSQYSQPPPYGRHQYTPAYGRPADPYNQYPPNYGGSSGRSYRPY
mmetsp:Transcript_8272/g.11726  ORF Transcript_8272/g.11726 Transcript_8272/m.11726 type:complete len:292 (+) Transcript_8272:152-1027(+)